MGDDYVRSYLAGASWCGYTKKAEKDLDDAAKVMDPSVQVQGYNVNDVITRLNCDLPATLPNQDAICKFAAKGYPMLVSCWHDDCKVVVDGYSQDYARKSAGAISSYTLGQ